MRGYWGVEGDGVNMATAGWYDDPEDPTRQRWWDGARWTENWRGRSAPPPPPLPNAVPSPGAFGSVAADDPWSAVGSAPGPSATHTWSPAPTRTFPDAIRACFQRYVDFRGRASRSEYWYFSLFTFLYSIPGNVVPPETLESVSGGAAGFWFVYFIGLLAVLPPSLSVSFRRLHDVGRSAWNLLWALLPIVGWIILFVYSVRPGEPGRNRYG